ncbi:tetratricopeptide repeat protein [Rhodoblastus acidophilus]|uniref:Tetratricopeptide repeat protein n=1 Tax=Candidatus Rhodoblastus alkanivorans TaxID=2954117 RepID=A0ABS9Z3B6_9HYPH|nr:tetratricopeptide repeat protein [Candidatus Rhodoblastus alkanivorans]MCI4682169.1 tetratricopeptide repeat protein [Candidatus Rhodoblastus alkanivorans]MDI4639471.1 tetratricopeptide repeat protein [Rhodoblastus acidophilus]
MHLTFVSARKSALFYGLALTLALLPCAGQAHQTAAISEPFEVGESPAGNYLSARVAEAEHDTFAASTFFREALRADPRNPELIQSAFVATLANGDMDAANALAQKLLQRDRHNASARLTLVVRDFRDKNFGAARALLKGGDGKGDLTTILLTAWSYVGSGDVKKAIALVDTMSDPSFAVFRDFHAGLMLDVAGRTAEAGARLKAAYGGDHSTLRLIDAYARNLARQGKIDEAKAVYAAFDKLQPHNPVVEAALADLAAGRKLEPMVQNVKAGAAEVLYGLGAYGLGAASSRAGDQIAAIVFLRLSLELAPEHALALDTLGEAYGKLKQYGAAIEIYDQVPDSSPLRVTTDIRIALLLDAMGKSDESVKQLRAIVKAHPENVDAISALADVLRSHKQFKESAEAYTKVLALTAPDDKSRWAIYYFRGVDYERAKDWPKAEPDLKEALDLYPEQPLVLNYLGYSWVDQGLHLDEAFKMLRRAVELQPDDGYIVDSLGWAHYKLGHYDEAVKYLEQAIDLKPGDPTINDHLGDAYWRVGRKLDAKFQWNHARDLHPDPEDLPKILSKIENGLPDDPQHTEGHAPATVAGKGD